MNERIKELAEQVGIEFDDDFSLEPETIYYLKLSDFEKFAELVRADEREACAKLLDDMAAKDKLSNYYAVAARAIRERDEK